MFSMDRHVSSLGRPLLAAVAALCIAACGPAGDETGLRSNPPAQTAAPATQSAPAANAVTAQAESAPTGAATAAAHVDAPPGIAWFDGSIEAAFERARAEDKPVFLYWGAVWCPYCADLKAYVFSRQDFKEKLKLFVPVYLDGDDPGAQRWADEFEVAGYPTVLALGPDKAELARIAGGMDVSVYAGMLDLVLGDVEPIGELLASVAGSRTALTADDCRRLAYNGWALDDAPAPADVDIVAALAQAAERCPAGRAVERARLTAIAAAYAIEAAAESGFGNAVENQLDGAEGPAPAAAAEPPARVTMLVDAVRDIVANEALAATVADALQYLDADFFAAAHALAPQRSTELRNDWSAAMDAVASDARYTEGDRLLAMRSKLEAVKALDPSGAVPAELKAEALAMIDAALDRATGTSAMSGAVNGAINVLATLEEYARAYAIAEQAMADSRTPYYYMADLAALDEELGRDDAAIAWLERAYQASTGPATRFQWGTNYVRGLIRMRPDDEAAIRDAATSVLAELDGPDRLYQRTLGRLDQLDASLLEWNENGARSETIESIRSFMDELCDRISSNEPRAAERCSAFLRPSGS